ncbi:MAG: hypothetical protein V4717_00590 [Bacteroidota bacterium]
MDKYTAAVKLVPAVNAFINLLKENLANGAIWESGEYSSNDSATGKPVMLRYAFQCVDANANIYVNGIAYQHLYPSRHLQDQMQLQITSLPAKSMVSFMQKQ